MGVARDYIPHYTYEDYRHWEGRWELIEGTPYAMSPAPLPKHQLVSAKIARQLDEALEGCKRCNAYLPLDWHVAEDTILQPDNLVLCYEPEGSYITKAPALIFEVISPSTALRDEHLKFEIYRREGVGYYILVYPDERLAKIYRLTEDGRYAKALDAERERYDFNLGPCRISFDFSKIWG